MSDRELLQAIGELIEEKLEAKLEEKLEAKFEEKLAPVNRRLDALEEAYVTLMENMTAIRLTIENEVRGNIKAVADGHSILLSALQHSLHHSETVEELIIKTNTLATTVRNIEQRMAASA